MDARAKFELRRKKILENAEARLQRITAGRYQSQIRQTDPRLENHIDYTKANGNDNLILPTSAPLSPPLDSSSTEGTEIWSSATSVLPELPAVYDNCRKRNGVPPQLFSSNNNDPLGGETEEKFGREEKSESKQVVKVYAKESWKDYAGFVALAVVIRLSFLFNYGWAIKENVLAPFLVVSLPRVVYLAGRRDRSRGSAAYVLLTLVKFKPGNITAILSVLYVLRQLSQFLAFYMFAFLVVHCFLEPDPERT